MLRPNIRAAVELRQRELAQLGDDSRLVSDAEYIVQVPYQTVGEYGEMFSYEFNPITREVTWTINEAGQVHVSMRSSTTYLVAPVNHCKTRHELVAEYFTGSMGTDAKWTMIDPAVTDLTTPDFIMQINQDTWLVMEIGTTLGSGAPCANQYRQKYVKYMSTMQKLIRIKPNIRIFFWIVIVSPNEVYSTFRLDGKAVNELITRFRIGIAMEDVLVNHGLIRKSDADLTEEERAISVSIQKLGSKALSGQDQVINTSSWRHHSRFEIDNQYMNSSLKQMLRQTMEKHTTKRDMQRDMEMSFILLEKEIFESGNTRLDKKAPVQMPLVLAKESQTEDLQSVHVMPSKVIPDAIDYVWREAYGDRLMNPSNFASQSAEEELQEALIGGAAENPDPNRNKWHRVTVKLSDEFEARLALDGLNGKKYQSTSAKEQRRQHQSRGFALSVDTTDIANCVSYNPMPYVRNLYHEKVSPLLDEANRLAGNSSKGAEIISELMSTDLVVALSQMSAIAQELAISLRQHTKPDGWIWKKILYYCVEMLVHPVNSESHVFFLLRYQGSPLNIGVFRNLYYYDGWYYTDLLSVNSSRIDNIIRGPAIYVNSLVHYRINLSRSSIEDLTISTNGLSEELAMLTLLVALEDKSQTEELALNVRYLCMQFLKGDDLLSPPVIAPVVKKMPTLMRSRLTVYLYQRVKMYCRKQWLELPTKMSVPMESSDHSADQFTGLICPFTHRPLRTCSDLVQIMYLAYAKNKDTLPEQNSDFSMIKKIADYCLNVDETKLPIYMGLKDPEGPPGPHEFSPSYLVEACNMIMRKFRGQMGVNWRKETEIQILKELIKVTHHESLATLKASADFRAEDAKMILQLEEQEEKKFSSLNAVQARTAAILLDLHRKGELDDLTSDRWAEVHTLIAMSGLDKVKNLGKGRFKRVSKSCKCFEAVVRILEKDESTRPLLIGDYSSIFESVMSESKGVCCYLFKKNQHGGLREIYVLTFKSRLLQLLPEVAARVLCSLCPEEVLTHPDRKTKGYETHHTNVIAAAGRGLSVDAIHRTSSEDKSKWCQSMNVSAFAFYFSRILSPQMSEAINRVLHAFRNKRVLLPEGVLNLLKNQTPISDGTYQSLLEDFWRGEESQHFEVIRGNVFMKTPTGMWQGILHYSSSFLHVLQTVHYKSLCHLHFKQVSENLSKDDVQVPIGRLVLDTVVSSDDSATYGTVILPVDHTPAIVARADRELDFLLKLEVEHSRYFMMTESVKSTISSRTVGEFNSIFSCSRTYISPSIKKILAATTIAENEDLESRQITLYNMHKDILEEGVSFFQVHLHELVNSYLHYISFGLMTTRLFPQWAEMITAHPDPHLGFYLLDLAEIAGAMGYDFKKYNSLKATTVPIMPSSPAAVRSGLEGLFSTGVVLTQGDRRRWLSFKARVVRDGWETYLEENPRVLYLEKGQSKEEISARLSAKACSKGVHDSLKYGNSLSRVIGSTVYLLKKKVITIKRLDLTEAKVSKESQVMDKASLMHLLDSQIKTQGENLQLSHQELTEDSLNLFYPNHKLYTAIAQTIRSMRVNQLIATVRYRKIRCGVEIRPGTNQLILPIITVVRYKWFSHPVKYASTTLENSWDHYRRNFDWLRPTLEETLEQSPFDSNIGLHNFLTSLDKKTSRLRILCRKLRSFNTYDQILELACFNYYPQLRRLRRDQDQQEDEEYVNFEESQASLLLRKASGVMSITTALVYAPVIGDVGHLLRRATDGVEFTEAELLEVSKSRNYSRPAILYVASKVSHGGLLKLSTLEGMLLQSGRGVIKHYIKPQKRNEYGEWCGPGRMAIRTANTAVEVLVFDKVVVGIKANNVSDLKREFQLICSYLTEDGFSWGNEKSISTYINHFPELAGESVTDWICSERGLIWNVQPTRVDRSRTGVISKSKVAYDPLKAPYPVVLQTIDNPFEPLDGVVSVHRGLNKGAGFLRLVLSKNDRDMTIMKFYGPKKPNPPRDLVDYFEDSSMDEESLLDCWLAGMALPPNISWALLRAATNPEVNPSSIQQAVEPHVLEGVDREQLLWFLKFSFKWRSIGSYKVHMDSFNYLTDLPGSEGQAPLFTHDMEVNFISVLDEIIGESQMFAQKEGIRVETEVGNCVQDWYEDALLGEAQGMDQSALISDLTIPGGEDEGLMINVLTGAPTNRSDEDLHNTSPEELNLAINDMNALPSIHMSHPLWDKIISKMDDRKIWISIREGITLAGENEVVRTAVLSLLDLQKTLPTEETSFEDFLLQEPRAS